MKDRCYQPHGAIELLGVRREHPTVYLFPIHCSPYSPWTWQQRTPEVLTLPKALGLWATQDEEVEPGHVEGRTLFLKFTPLLETCKM